MISFPNENNRERLVKGYRLSVIRQIRSEELVDNMVAIVDKTVLYNQNLLRE